MNSFWTKGYFHLVFLAAALAIGAVLLLDPEWARGGKRLLWQVLIGLAAPYVLSLGLSLLYRRPAERNRRAEAQPRQD